MQTDTPRPESRWRVIKEGEISPFKILVVIFIRENYFHIELSRGSAEDRIASLLCIYKLVSSSDMSFSKMKEILYDPNNHIRVEVLRRFNKIIENLEEDNASFLYELAHSIIDIESSQTVILRKRIGKNSPFGKFLRLVLLHIRKLSYPQVLYLYKELIRYIWHSDSDTIRTISDIIPIIPSNFENELSESETESNLNKPDFETPNVEMDLETPKNPEVDSEDDFESDIEMEIEELKDTGLSESEDNENSIEQPTSDPLDTSKFEVTSTSSNDKIETSDNEISSIVVTESIVPPPLIQKSRTIPFKEWKFDKFAPIEKKAALPQVRRKGLDVFKGVLQKRFEKNMVGFGMNLLEEFNAERSLHSSPQQNISEIKEENANLNSDKQTRILKALEAVKKLRNVWNGPNEDIVKDEMDFEIQEPLIDLDTSYDTSGNCSLSIVKENDFGYFVSREEASFKSPEKHQSKLPLDPINILSGSKRWEEVKWWSRKQIEKQLKILGNDLYHSKTNSYTPLEISSFIEAIKFNPSSKVLHPQIHYLEYLNSLRIKDISRCIEALRTSFDLRIKPNTSEINKGTPYAAYNFATFYRLMEYDKDSMMFLEEAFQAGHSAGDATCLHYCHNLWCRFHNKPYTEAIVTVTKEVDKYMAYLHSVNVIANAFDYHYQGLPPKEILYTLWHYNAECDLEEVESLLLISLSTFFGVFDWHHLVSFPCQIILLSSLNWPSRAYCAALCLLAQCLLVNGEIENGKSLMEYGRLLFGFDASPAGVLFGLEDGIVKAMEAYLGYNPVPDDVIATIAAFNKTEALYWRAYSKMILNEWDESGRILKNLMKCFDKKTCELNDLKIRCLFLKAELECLCRCPIRSLNHLFEALEISREIFSDFYISLCLINIASVQNELELLRIGTRTLHEDIRAIIRCSAPMIESRNSITNVQLLLAFKETPLSIDDVEFYMETLTSAEKIYHDWKNDYRLKEIYHLKLKLLFNAIHIELGESESNKIWLNEQKASLAQTKEVFDKLKPILRWDPKTCII